MSNLVCQTGPKGHSCSSPTSFDLTQHGHEFMGLIGPTGSSIGPRALQEAHSHSLSIRVFLPISYVAIWSSKPLGTAISSHKLSRKNQNLIEQSYCGELSQERDTKMASFLQSFLDPKKNWFAAQHMKALSTRLRHYGSSSNLNPSFYYFYEIRVFCGCIYMLI